MRKLALWLGSGVLAFVAVALLFDGLVGLLQPEFEGDGRSLILVSFDADGARHETRLAVEDDDEGHTWVQSGHHFRGWYERVLANPEVLVVRNGETRPYTAVPIDTPETETHVKELFRRRGGPIRFAIIRALLLWADIKPVRLDPR